MSPLPVVCVLARVFSCSDVPPFFPQTDLVALAESLAMGLASGSTTGDIIVAEVVDASSTIPNAVEPTEHTAAIVVNFAGAPEVRAGRSRTTRDRYSTHESSHFFCFRGLTAQQCLRVSLMLALSSIVSLVSASFGFYSHLSALVSCVYFSFCLLMYVGCRDNNKG